MIQIKNSMIVFALVFGIAFTLTAEGCSNVNNNDTFSIELSETDADGQIKTVTYELEDLSYSIYDSDENLIDSGSAFENESKVIDPEATIYWYPTDNANGFKSGNGIAVTGSVKTNSDSSKTIGLTSGGSSTSTSKNPSAILYTGTSGYWKFYVTNHSSSSLKVTGGSLSQAE